MRKYLILPLIVLNIFTVPEPLRAQMPDTRDQGDTVITGPLLYGLNQNFFKNADSVVYYAEKLITIGQESVNYPLTCYAMQLGGEGYRTLGNFPRSLELQFTALQMNRDRKDILRQNFTSSFIGFTFLQSEFFDEALHYLLPAKKNLEENKIWIQSSFTSSNIAYCYLRLNHPDSAKWYNNESKRLIQLDDDNSNPKNALRTLINDRSGNIFEAEGKLDSAETSYRLSLQFAMKDNILVNISRGYRNLARIMQKRRLPDSAIIYAWRTLHFSAKDKQQLHALEAANLLSDIYSSRGNTDSALFYLTRATELRENIYGTKNFRTLLSHIITNQENQQKETEEKIRQQNNQRLILISVIALAFLALTLIQLRNNRIKQRINKKLEDKKATLEQTLAELKETQSRLIQSEKMASLGQLTAGIAHEIENPLNFINNFSEVNAELTSELEEELKKGNMEDASALAADIRSNQLKILDHGKRADKIVKSMMLHSMPGSGKKEPADINKLVEEYAELAYNGYKSGNRDFTGSVQIQTTENPVIISVVAQDIGRVIINLLDNAFYTVQERSAAPGSDFDPVIKISVIKKNGMVEISIRDNGVGIPEKIRDKIFQPFFTTKPTGQGTGLGLSLSYDIVTKGHGGEILVETKEGMGSTFIVKLPKP